MRIHCFPDHDQRAGAQPGDCRGPRQRRRHPRCSHLFRPLPFRKVPSRAGRSSPPSGTAQCSTTWPIASARGHRDDLPVRPVLLPDHRDQWRPQSVALSATEPGGGAGRPSNEARNPQAAGQPPDPQEIPARQPTDHRPSVPNHDHGLLESALTQAHRRSPGKAADQTDGLTDEAHPRIHEDASMLLAAVGSEPKRAPSGSAKPRKGKGKGREKRAERRPAGIAPRHDQGHHLRLPLVSRGQLGLPPGPHRHPNSLPLQVVTASLKSTTDPVVASLRPVAVQVRSLAALLTAARSKTGSGQATAGEAVCRSRSTRPRTVPALPPANNIRSCSPPPAIRLFVIRHHRVSLSPEVGVE